MFYLSSISAMPLSQTNCNNCFFHPISAMPLPQIHSHNFFSPQFRQWHCHKPTEINFFPAISTWPQFHSTFFCHKRTWQTKLFRSKKYWKNKNMHTFFFISPLFRQCHCHKPIATIVFFILFRQCHCHKFIPTFPPLFRQWHCHKPIGTIFFASYFGNAIATIPFHFFFSFFFLINDKCTQFLQYFHNKF